MARDISRRNVLTGAITSGIAAGASTNILHDTHAATASAGSDIPQKEFMDQFYHGALDIIRGIRDTQADVIAQAMEKAYELKRNGGTIYSHVHSGHYAVFAGSRDRPGQPWLLPQPGYRPQKRDFDAMKKGDFLLTSCVDEQTQEVHDRGVYVAGVTCNYYRYNKTPQDGLIPERMKLAIEDIADIVIDSQVPWNNGLVYTRHIPGLALCPSAGLTQMSVYWSATASLANLVGTDGKGSASEPVRTYLDKLNERFEMIGTDRPKIDCIAGVWADFVLRKGARILVYGHPQDVRPFMGNRNMFVNDSYVCSSGPMITDAYEKKAAELRDSDIVLIGAFTSDNSQEIEAARHAHSAGALTVAFCPYTTDGDASGERLYKEVDYAVNTLGEESAGVLDITGFRRKVCPVSGLSGNLVMWMLIAQWADHMCRRGEVPFFWKGFHENGGREYDNMVHPYFIKRGY